MRAVVPAAGALLATVVIVVPGAASRATRHQPGRGPKAGIAKQRVGNFDAPMYLTHAPGAANFL